MHHDTIIEGKKYRLHLLANGGFTVRSVRVDANGNEVEAFLSNRQHKAEERAKRRFAKLIEEHKARLA